MIKQKDKYYLFCTGMGISVSSSVDMKTWVKEKSVFDTPPSWAVNSVPGFKGHIWAPDISLHNGLYYLFYSISAFGKNTSCIGLAINKTLDPADPDFNWIDQGKVIQSVPGRDLWNAIDPNLMFDGDNVPWLAFGSFWSGIKLVKLNNDLNVVAQPEEWYSIAKRERSFKVDDYKPGEGAIEAPFLFKKDDYYYLFVSFDYCCKGADSNYKVMVGRSKKIQGPYLDKSGLSMNEGGGSLVVEGNKQWAGVGHNSVYTFGDQDYIIFHAYDVGDGGKPKLKTRQLKWDNNWPQVINNLD